MKKLLILLIFNCLSTVSLAQTDSLPAPKVPTRFEKIASSRLELLNTFLMDDPAGAALWMDSLSRLENATHAGLIWDERWLLYFWTESYGTLFEEVSRYGEFRDQQAYKIQPVPDSLFQWVDYTLNEKRFDIFSNIRSAFLNEEEKAFATLLLDYLLRLNQDEEEWAGRLQSFEDHYPSSRFLSFVQNEKPTILKPSKQAFGFSAGLQLGNWKGEIERSLTSPTAFNMDVYYWKKRWNYLFDASFGGPTLRRDIVEGRDIWPEEDPTSFFTLGLGLGYDLVNAKKVRVFPSVGGGVGFLRPPTPGEDEDPLPDYYTSFNFSEFHLSAGVTVDVKLFQKNYRNWGLPKGSYHGIRLKLGWNGLNFGNKNEDLKGELFYFAVHYNLFALMTEQ